MLPLVNHLEYALHALLTLEERRQTGGQTDRQTDRRTEGC